MGESCKKTEALAHPGLFAERKNTMQEVILGSLCGGTAAAQHPLKAYQRAERKREMWGMTT